LSVPNSFSISGRSALGLWSATSNDRGPDGRIRAQAEPVLTSPFECAAKMMQQWQ
jgi:hypothetical protein